MLHIYHKGEVFYFYLLHAQHFGQQSISCTPQYLSQGACGRVDGQNATVTSIEQLACSQHVSALLYKMSDIVAQLKAVNINNATKKFHAIIKMTDNRLCLIHELNS